jgi:TPR repeat protein
MTKKGRINRWARSGIKAVAAIPDLTPLLLVLMLVGPAVAGVEVVEEGYDAFERGDIDAAFKIWHDLAEQGDSTAQFNLGQMYRLGKGVQVDDQEALKWYLMAAKGGKISAKHNLILMYEEGRLTRADIAPLLATSNARLEELNPEDFLVQVITTFDRADLDKYMQTHQASLQQPVLVVLMYSKGKDLYALYLGPFPELAEAEQALAALPATIRALGAWIRKVSSVKEVSK